MLLKICGWGVIVLYICVYDGNVFCIKYFWLAICCLSCAQCRVNIHIFRVFLINSIFFTNNYVFFLSMYSLTYFTKPSGRPQITEWQRSSTIYSLLHVSSNSIQLIICTCLAMTALITWKGWLMHFMYLQSNAMWNLQYQFFLHSQSLCIMIYLIN